jgi:hypothetical protein
MSSEERCPPGDAPAYAQDAGALAPSTSDDINSGGIDESIGDGVNSSGGGVNSGEVIPQRQGRNLSTRK